MNNETIGGFFLLYIVGCCVALTLAAGAMAELEEACAWIFFWPILFPIWLVKCLIKVIVPILTRDWK